MIAPEFHTRRRPQRPPYTVTRLGTRYQPRAHSGAEESRKVRGKDRLLCKDHYDLVKRRPFLSWSELRMMYSSAKVRLLLEQ